MGARRWSGFPRCGSPRRAHWPRKSVTTAQHHGGARYGWTLVKASEPTKANVAVRLHSFQFSSSLQLTGTGVSCELQAAVRACDHKQACSGSAAADTSSPSAAHSAQCLPTRGPPGSALESESHTQRHSKELAEVPSPDLMIRKVYRISRLCERTLIRLYIYPFTCALSALELAVDSSLVNDLTTYWYLGTRV